MMTRKLGLALVTAGTMIALTACSSGGGSTGGGESTDETGTLRVLVPNFPADTAGNATFQHIVDVFHETYPNVEVQSDFVPYDGLNQKISTSVASGQGYDVISAGIGWVQPIADLGAIQSLKPLGVTKEQLEETVYPSFVPPMLWEDEVYALPVVANPRVLAYSKSAFEEAGLDPEQPPQSLDELRAYAKKLTKRDSSGNITQTGFDFWSAPSNYRQQFVAFLGALGGQEFTDAEPTFNTPAGVEALQVIHDMVSVDKSSTYGYENSAKTSLVSTGEAAMGFASPYVDCSDEGIGDKCDDLVYFNLQDEREVEYLGGRVVAVGAQTELPEASLALAKAFTEKESQELISKLDVGVPVGKDAGDSEFVNSNPASTWAWQNLDKGVFEYGDESFLDFRAEFGPALDEAILGKSSPQEVLDELAQVASR